MSSKPSSNCLRKNYVLNYLTFGENQSVKLITTVLNNTLPTYFIHTEMSR